MGRAYMFKCQKCGYEYDISIGIGFGLLSQPHNELYVCQCCGKWKVVGFLPAFPNDNILELNICDSSTNQFKCDSCGNDMEEVEADHISSLSCPKCETDNETSEIMMWD